MINRIINLSLNDRVMVLLAAVLLAIAGLLAYRTTPLDAIPDLRAGITYCEAHKDYVTRDLFDSILVSEEEHVDWLETQIGLIEKVGVQNYQQSQT